MKTYEECFAHITAGRPFSLTLYAVPLKFRDYNMCLAAVTAEGWTIEAVPANLRDYKMCLAAVIGHGSNLKYVPKDLPGREFLEILANSK